MKTRRQGYAYTDFNEEYEREVAWTVSLYQNVNQDFWVLGEIKNVISTNIKIIFSKRILFFRVE